MSDINYLKRLFQAYYKEKKEDIPFGNLNDHREFGFIPWEKKIFMKRHMSFKTHDSLSSYLIENGPRHAYLSGALYLKPDNLDMDNKEYQGCDLIIDIDVDHFYTPCKDKHDLWWCKECKASGKGMMKKCPECGKLKIKSLTWICDECLELAKREVVKLIDSFLIPDFGIKESEMHIAFSGHRGYHLKVENEKIRTLASDERREIVDYLTGKHISFEILGLREKGGIIFGLSRENIGWTHKIIKKIEEFLIKPKEELEKELLDKRKFDFNPKLVKSFLNYKDDFLQIISGNQNNVWAIEGFGLKTWEKFLTEITNGIGIEIDEPVSIDIHRLIRYPGSLHGKTGFKVQELEINQLDNFNPLNESNEKLDPIVFRSKSQITQKIEITENSVPITKILDETFGPYKKGDKDEVPHHIAVFFLCKGVAKTI